MAPTLGLIADCGHQNRFMPTCIQRYVTVNLLGVWLETYVIEEPKAQRALSNFEAALLGGFSFTDQ